MISACRERLLRSEIWRAWRNIWHDYLLPLLRLFVLLPVLASVLAFSLLATNGQMREILMRIAEQLDLASLAFGLMGLGVFGSAVFFHIKANTSGRYKALYSHSSQIRLPWWMRGLRISLAYFFAGFPFAAVAWVIISLPFDAGTRLPLLLVWLVVLVLLLFVLRGLDAVRFSTRTYRTSIPLVSAALVFSPLFVQADYLIYYARAAGPLALTGLQLASGFIIATLLVRLIRAYWSIVPYAAALWLVALLVVVVGGRFIAPFEQLQPSAPVTAEPRAPDATRTHLAAAFDAWLNQPSHRGRRDGPIYIVAAEGGGIYAASAVATFLTALKQDCAPCAGRVFAITGVSGGAVGAALYSAASLFDDGVEEEGARVREVLQADHLSPVLTVLVPDLVLSLSEDLAGLILYPLGLELPWHLTDYVTRRDAMIERSLECPGNPFAAGCAQSSGRGLRASLAEHWAGGARHALILNTTAESGATVAFAPFPLRDLGDPDLSSFLDKPYALTPDKISAVTAASASARFPLVLPPYVSNRRNFVDGGYADNSGLASAGAIFQSLTAAARSIQSAPDARTIDIRLILLTSAEASGYGAPGIADSSGFRDLAVPFYALLNVRARIGPQNVARTINQFGGQTGRLVDVLQIGSNFFLGWTISQTTIDRIACHVGVGACGHDHGPAKVRDKNRKGYCRIVNSVEPDRPC
jgi:hypothetical protein